VVATSGNYLSHLAEMGRGAPRQTTSFIVSPTSLIGSGEPIRLPATHPTMVDWEGEFCLVFSRHCHAVSPQEAMDHIGGYTIYNDVSARDWASRVETTDSRQAILAWRSNVMFKQFPSFGPLGPVVTTADEVHDVDELRLTTTVNGEVMQDDLVGDMHFSFSEIISEVSATYAFAPGDILTMGTPAGVGFARDPQIFLSPGDEVAVTVDGVGTLRNPVVTDAHIHHNYW
jgi:acylpyruvate hydrolase